jgi:hypothetical protein
MYQSRDDEWAILIYKCSDYGGPSMLTCRSSAVAPKGIEERIGSWLQKL